tara:strand:- start:1477 stop:1908 length:432 start_codon:yes stop_codon:yes gene_type:complete
MAYQIEGVDLTWSSEGDLFFDVNQKDLEDTRHLAGRDILQRVDARLSSASGDYYYMKDSEVADVGSYMGRINNASTASEIMEAITYALTSGGFLSQSEFQVDIAPDSPNSIIVFLIITPSGQRRSQMIAYSFDLRQRFLTRRA